MYVWEGAFDAYFQAAPSCRFTDRISATDCFRPCVAQRPCKCSCRHSWNVAHGSQFTRVVWILQVPNGNVHFETTRNTCLCKRQTSFESLIILRSCGLSGVGRRFCKVPIWPNILVFMVHRSTSVPSLTHHLRTRLALRRRIEPCVNTVLARSAQRRSDNLSNASAVFSQ